MNCNIPCLECQYYQDIYHPKIHFIHQIEFPAAVYKDLHFWGGNRHWGELCEVDKMDLVEMGIERVIHTESLEMMISNHNKRALGEPVPISSSVFLKNKLRGKIKVTIFIFPMSQALGTFLVLAKNDQKA